MPKKMFRTQSSIPRFERFFEAEVLSFLRSSNISYDAFAAACAVVTAGRQGRPLKQGPQDAAMLPPTLASAEHKDGSLCREYIQCRDTKEHDGDKGYDEQLIAAEAKDSGELIACEKGEWAGEQRREDYMRGVSYAAGERSRHNAHLRRAEECSGVMVPQTEEGRLLLRLALSSLEYPRFRRLMRDYRASQLQGRAAAEELGIL